MHPKRELRAIAARKAALRARSAEGRRRCAAGASVFVPALELGFAAFRLARFFRTKGGTHAGT